MRFLLKRPTIFSSMYIAMFCLFIFGYPLFSPLREVLGILVPLLLLVCATFTLILSIFGFVTNFTKHGALTFSARTIIVFIFFYIAISNHVLKHSTLLAYIHILIYEAGFSSCMNRIPDAPFANFCTLTYGSYLDGDYYVIHDSVPNIRLGFSSCFASIFSSELSEATAKINSDETLHPLCGQYTIGFLRDPRYHAIFGGGYF